MEARRDHRPPLLLRRCSAGTFWVVVLAAAFVLAAPAAAQINGNTWETAVANLCHSVGWPALTVFNGSILAAGGCRDPSCLNETASLCNIDPTAMRPHAMVLRAIINSTATRDLHVSGNTGLLVTAASEVLLIRACSNLVPPYPSGPDWRPDDDDVAEFRRVYSVDIATGIARERTQLRLPESRANATCIVSGRYIYVAGGVSLPAMVPSTDIDVLLPLASIVRAKRYSIPTDYGAYGTTGMAGRGLAEGFVLVQPGITGITPYTFRVTIFATQLAANNGTLAPSPPPMVAYNGDPVISGSDDERIAVSISSHKLFVMRDPFTTIVYQDLVPKGTASKGWNLYTATGATAVIGATPLLVQEATSSASFIAYIGGGFTAGMPVGPPQNMLQQTTLLSSDPCPNFFVTPRTVHANVPFLLTMTLRARFGWRLRLSATPDCAEAISPTVDWHTNMNSVNMTAFTASGNAFVCYAGKEVTLNGVKDEAVGPFNLFDVTNELQPMIVLPEPPATTTPAPTTTAAPTTTTTTAAPPTTTTTTTLAPNTTLPPSASTTTAITTGTARPETSTVVPPSTTTTAGPESTTAAPDHHHAASSGGIPMAAWAVGTVAVVALSATVVFLVIAVARPSSAPAQMLRAIVRCCPGESTHDDSIADINATQLHVLKRIGAGGWGTVYLCQRGASKGGRDDMIAVKHIPCSRNVARSLAMREIRVLQSVQGHPNVVRVFEMLVREELVTAEDKRSSKRGSRAAADVDDDRDDSSSSGADDGAAAVTTLHEHRGAGGGTTTYALRTKGKRGGRINADSGAKPADDDGGDDSSVYAESYHSGDGGGVVGGGGEQDVDVDSMYSAADGTSWHNELENRSSQAASGAPEGVADEKHAPPARRRRQEGPEVHRFLCIVMRYYGRGDLRRWVGSSFALGPGFNPLAAGFPSLRGAPTTVPSQQFATGSTMFSEYGGGGMSPPNNTNTNTQLPAANASWALSVRAAQLPDDFGVPVPETLLMSVAMQLVSTLAHLHNQGILHCDIKPENVLIADEIPKRYLQSRAERQRAKRAQRVKAGDAKPLRRNGRPVGDADDGAGSGTAGGANPSGELPAGAHRFFLPIVVTDFGVAQVIRKDHRKREERRRARLQVEAANSAGTLNGTSTIVDGGGDTAPGGTDALSTGPAGFTLPYVAPEVVAGGMSGFSDKSDVWAAGVLVYGLATKQLLSGDLETSFLFERVRRCRTREAFLAAIAGDLLCVGYTPPVAEYIATMLDPNPELRPSAARCLVGLVKVGPLRYVPSTAVPRAQQQPQSSPKRSIAATRGAAGGHLDAAAAGTGDESSTPVTPGGQPHPQDLTVPLLEDV